MGNVVALRRFEQNPVDNETGKSRMSETELYRRMAQEMKLKHFRPSTQKSYLGAVREFIAYRKRTHSGARKQPQISTSYPAGPSFKSSRPDQLTP